MKQWVHRAAIAAIAVIAGAVTVGAHHSHAMFDTSREVAIVGVVKRVTFANPHVFIYLDVTDPKGKLVTWAIEMSNITNMEQRGIYRSTFKIGETITAKVNPLRDGRPGGNYTSIIGPDGKVYD
jgi:uncharacterized protein DUF6152